MIAPDEALMKALRASPLLEGHSIEAARGETDALRHLRRRAFDVLVTAPDTCLEEDEAILDEVRVVRPGVRIVLLAPQATPEEVIVALRARVFACFSSPFDASEIADMVARAVEAEQWKNGIQVVSATPDWISVLVNCRLLSAERLVNFLTEMRSDVPESPRDDFMFAFREVLLNAMEHGGGFDPDQVVEVMAVRTARTRSAACSAVAFATTIPPKPMTESFSPVLPRARRSSPPGPRSRSSPWRPAGKSDRAAPAPAAPATKSRLFMESSFARHHRPGGEARILLFLERDRRWLEY